MDLDKFTVMDGGETIKIIVNSKIYPLSTIYSASYVFIDRCFIFLDGDPNEEIIVKLTPKNTSSIKLDVLAGEFLNELINYAFYEVQSKKNIPLRNTLLHAALLTNAGINESNASESEEFDKIDLSEIDDLDDEVFDDPEGIAVPWEEKYGKSTDNLNTDDLSSNLLCVSSKNEECKEI